MGFLVARGTCFADGLRGAHLPIPATSDPMAEQPGFLRCSSSARSPFFVRGGFCLGRSGVMCTIAGLVLAAISGWGQTQAPEPPGQLIRETVYNELHDHDTHGYWRYWIEQHLPNATRLAEEVETADGPISRVVATNGHPVGPAAQDDERARLERLVNSPQERASHRKEYAEDEKHVALVMQLLPEAYVFEYAGEENGCHHLRYRPSATYVPRTMEARVVHSMTGDVWIDARLKRLSRLEGHLEDRVDFGFGLLGRLDKGGWFRMQRVQVSSTEWKTQQLEVHMSGRALLLKTVGRQTSEVRGGYVAVPAQVDLAQGVRILDQTDPKSPPNTVAHVYPASFAGRQ